VAIAFNQDNSLNADNRKYKKIIQESATVLQVMLMAFKNINYQIFITVSTTNFSEK
jgi:hypothetical protein